MAGPQAPAGTTPPRASGNLARADAIGWPGVSEGAVAAADAAACRLGLDDPDGTGRSGRPSAVLH